MGYYSTVNLIIKAINMFKLPRIFLLATLLMFQSQSATAIWDSFSGFSENEDGTLSASDNPSEAADREEQDWNSWAEDYNSAGSGGRGVPPVPKFKGDFATLGPDGTVLGFTNEKGIPVVHHEKTDSFLGFNMVDLYFDAIPQVLDDSWKGTVELNKVATRNGVGINDYREMLDDGSTVERDIVLGLSYAATTYAPEVGFLTEDQIEVQYPENRAVPQAILDAIDNKELPSLTRDGAKIVEAGIRSTPAVVVDRANVSYAAMVQSEKMRAEIYSRDLFEDDAVVAHEGFHSGLAGIRDRAEKTANTTHDVEKLADARSVLGAVRSIEAWAPQEIKDFVAQNTQRPTDRNYLDEPANYALTAGLDQAIANGFIDATSDKEFSELVEGIGGYTQGWTDATLTDEDKEIVTNAIRNAVNDPGLSQNFNQVADYE